MQVRATTVGSGHAAHLYLRSGFMRCGGIPPKPCSGTPKVVIERVQNPRRLTGLGWQVPRENPDLLGNYTRYLPCPLENGPLPKSKSDDALGHRHVPDERGARAACKLLNLLANRTKRSTSSPIFHGQWRPARLTRMNVQVKNSQADLFMLIDVIPGAGVDQT